jgi:uncharacterized coiled-coil protein SlyX
MQRSIGSGESTERISTPSALSSGNVRHDDNNLPATKQDLTELRADVDRRFDQLRDELTEAMRDMQTEVLRAFHAWARPLEIRLRALPQIEERLGLLEERVGAIERGPGGV